MSTLPLTHESATLEEQEAYNQNTDTQSNVDNTVDNSITIDRRFISRESIMVDRDSNPNLFLAGRRHYLLYHSNCWQIPLKLQYMTVKRIDFAIDR